VLSKGQLADLFSNGIGTGELALLGCALSWAAYTLLGKQMMMSSKHALDPLTLVTYSCISGSLILAAWIILSGHEVRLNLSINLVGSIGYLSMFGTVAGFIWYFQGIREIGAAQGAVFVFFVPVSAIILGYLWLDESITMSLLLGAILILSGVALVNKKITRPLTKFEAITRKLLIILPYTT
ncbi:MAG: DMT family transporter, partial [Gammaproteobacteria bacterium]|nr:DMT family transporter [Gammaproteobacteria bacterium]